jgi:hypothetical protein
MARISTYSSDSTPSLSDKVIGTDNQDFQATKNFIISDILSLATFAPATEIPVYFTQTVSIGDPVYITGWNTTFGVPTVANAVANSSSTMPCVGLAIQSVAAGNEGVIIVTGVLSGVTLGSASVNQIVYVSPTGGLTLTKPVNPNLIQKVGVVTEVVGSLIKLFVETQPFYNQLPNLTAQRFWYGGTSAPAETSTALYYEPTGGVGGQDVVGMEGTLYAQVSHPDDARSLAIGDSTIPIISGLSQTTVFGVGAGNFTGGVSNTFVGYLSGKYFNSSNPPSNLNTAFGAFALSSDGGENYGDGNTAIGYNALKTLGRQGGLYNAVYNTAVGANSLHLCEGGEFNVAVGNDALFNLLNAKNNTAIGKAAGSTNTIFWNTTCLGHNAQPQASDEVILGDNVVTTLRCNTQVISTLSDARDKSEVEDLSVGLDFLMDVRPVQWVWDRRDGSIVGKVDSGFLAQQLDEARATHNAEAILHNLVNKANDEAWASGQAALIPVLVKAIQELKGIVDTLSAEILILKGDG